MNLEEFKSVNEMYKEYVDAEELISQLDKYSDADKYNIHLVVRANGSNGQIKNIQLTNNTISNFKKFLFFIQSEIESSVERLTIKDEN